MTTADPLRDYEEAVEALVAAKLAGDPAAVIEAGKGRAAAEHQLGLLFAQLLRCALDAPTTDVRAMALALQPVVDQALAGQVEWQRRKICELLDEVRIQGEAIARLEAGRHDAAHHSPDQPGRAGHGQGHGGFGAGAGRGGDSAGAGGPAAGREAG